MRNVLTVFIASFYLFNLNAQVYDGKGNVASFLGYEIGKYQIVNFGSDYGLSDIFSIGVSFNFLTGGPDKENINLLAKFDVLARVDIHGGSFLKLEKSDVFVGYATNFSGTHGTHLTYQYFMNDFFGFYGQGNYYFKRKEDDFLNFTNTDKITVSGGIIFRMFANRSYRSW